jgi:hypothetical protein
MNVRVILLFRSFYLNKKFNKEDVIMKKITFIPAKNSLKNTGKLKVAAYCRVSTEHETQHSSIDLQINYYTDLIQTNPK